MMDAVLGMGTLDHYFVFRGELPNSSPGDSGTALNALLLSLEGCVESLDGIGIGR